MHIALCDDEVYETDHLCALIEAYAIQKDYDIRCTKFNSGKDLLKADKFDLYFLDYKMDDMNGVEVALALKEKFQPPDLCRRLFEKARGAGAAV